MEVILLSNIMCLLCLAFNCTLIPQAWKKEDLMMMVMLIHPGRQVVMVAANMEQTKRLVIIRNYRINILRLSKSIISTQEETILPWDRQLATYIIPGFPEIKTYRSCDLIPASWVSVVWYPLYRIPVGPTLQNIDACFLTFHSLAKPVRSGERMRDGGCKLMLPTFGLVSYKFKACDWIANGVLEDQKVNSLLQAADNWLPLLQVDHPDYSIFVSHNTNWR